MSGIPERNGVDEVSGQKQSLIDAGIWQTSGQLVSGFLAWLLILIMSREDIGLGPTSVGVLNIGAALVALFTMLTLGIKKSTSQKISVNILNKKLALVEARNGVFAIFFASIMMGVALIIASFFIAFPITLQNELSFLFFTIGLLMFLFWYRDGTQTILAGLGEYNKIAKSLMIFIFFEFLIGVFLIVIIKSFNFPITLIFVAYCLGVIAQILILYKYFKPHRPYYPALFRFNLRNHETYKNIRQGFFFAVTEIIPFGFLGTVSLIFLFAFTNDFAISGAYSIVIGYSFAGLMVTNFAWPLITHIAEAYGKGDFKRIQHYLKLIVKVFFYVTFLILTIIIGLSQGFLLNFYGLTYLTGPTDVWIPFILCGIATSIAGFEYLLCGVLLGIGKGKPAAIYLGITFLLTIGISSIFLWLNPFTPQINASLGYLIGTLIMLPGLPYLLKKEMNQQIQMAIGLRSFLAFICALTLAIILVWPPLNLIPISNLFIFLLLWPFLGIIYIIFLVFFGSVSQEDFKLLEKKLEAYKLKRYMSPILAFLQKVMRISPFCNKNEREEKLD